MIIDIIRIACFLEEKRGKGMAFVKEIQKKYGVTVLEKKLLMVCCVFVVVFAIK